MRSLSEPFMCELQYGTTPSLEFGESPRPRSPMIVLYGTSDVIGIAFIAIFLIPVLFYLVERFTQRKGKIEPEARAVEEVAAGTTKH